MVKTLKDYLLNGEVKEERFIHSIKDSTDYFIYSPREIVSLKDKIFLQVNYLELSENLKGKKLQSLILLNSLLNDEKENFSSKLKENKPQFTKSTKGNQNNCENNTSQDITNLIITTIT